MRSHGSSCSRSAPAQRQALTERRAAAPARAPPALRALIEKQAEGNPFYAEELVKMLIDDGVILVEGEHWRVLEERLSVARIPGTLTGVLQARLDALSAAERRAVQLASVVGPVFWDDALHALDPAAPSMLQALEQKAMVQTPAESAFAGTREDGVPAPPPAPGDLRHGSQVRSSRGARAHGCLAGGAGRRPRGRVPRGHGRALRARRRPGPRPRLVRARRRSPPGRALPTKRPGPTCRACSPCRSSATRAGAGPRRTSSSASPT